MSQPDAVADSPLDLALVEARRRYLEKRPRTADAHRRAREYLPGGNTRTVLFHGPAPLRIVSGDGAYITDADGHRYLNLLGEYTAGLFGHSHPAIRKAIDAALDRGLNLSAHNPDEIELARLVCERFPSIERVRFTNSGTEANLMAVATARHHTGRNKVMVMNGGYHGGLLYFGGGGIPINAPYPFVLAEYNDVDRTAALIEAHARDLACVLVEPMIGAGGCIPATREFLGMLRRQTQRHGVLLIFDEVMTSRLSPGGVQQLEGVTPDMTTLGKYIGGGMSFGAFGGTAAIMTLYDPESPGFLPHAGTFNNNTLTMAAGVAAMGAVYTADAALDLNARGERLRERLNQACRERHMDMQFTGRGSLMAFHPTPRALARPADAADADDRIRELVFLALLERGFYIARRGFIALMLPVTDGDVDDFVAAFEDVLEVHFDTLAA